MKYAQIMMNTKWSVALFVLTSLLIFAGCNVQTSSSDAEKDTIIVVDKKPTQPADTKPQPPVTDPPKSNTVLPDGNEEQPSKDDFLIVPGKSMGKISLGMSQEKALEILGKPDATDAAMGTYVYTWKGKTSPDKSEVNVVTGYAGADMKERIVKLIRTTSMYFHTKEGAGTEKNFSEVKKLFPGLSFVKTYQSENHRVKTDLYANKAKGIVFECLNYGPKLCVGVQVVVPGSQIPFIEF